MRPILPSLSLPPPFFVLWRTAANLPFLSYAPSPVTRRLGAYPDCIFFSGFPLPFEPPFSRKASLFFPSFICELDYGVRLHGHGPSHFFPTNKPPIVFRPFFRCRRVLIRSCLCRALTCFRVSICDPPPFTSPVSGNCLVVLRRTPEPLSSGRANSLPGHSYQGSLVSSDILACCIFRIAVL